MDFYEPTDHLMIYFRVVTTYYDLVCVCVDYVLESFLVGFGVESRLK